VEREDGNVFCRSEVCKVLLVWGYRDVCAGIDNPGQCCGMRVQGDGNVGKARLWPRCLQILERESDASICGGVLREVDCVEVCMVLPFFVRYPKIRTLLIYPSKTISGKSTRILRKRHLRWAHTLTEKHVHKPRRVIDPRLPPQVS